jgi:glycosyltransferase involved in cell wall biosynthesis
MLRVKNEAAQLEEVLNSIFPLCERVFVLDDHSTDNTVEICQRYSQVTVFNSQFDGMNEARDKNWLLDQILRTCQPDWILCIDGDEVLEAGGADIIRQTVNGSNCEAYSMEIAYLWNSPTTVRVDRVYGNFWRPSLFRPFHPDPNKPDQIKLCGDFRFMVTPFGRKVDGREPNLHCSSVPQRLLHGHQRCPVKLKHYGYMDRQERVRKLDFYTSIDWNNKAEDCYRHMTQGDGVKLEELPKTQELLKQGFITMKDVEFITDVPEDKVLVHAGPLELAPYESLSTTAK